MEQRYIETLKTQQIVGAELIKARANDADKAEQDRLRGNLDELNAHARELNQVVNNSHRHGGR